MKRASWVSRARRRSAGNVASSKRGRITAAIRSASSSVGPLLSRAKTRVLISRWCTAELRVRRIAFGTSGRSSESRTCHGCHSKSALSLSRARVPVNQTAYAIGIGRSPEYLPRYSRRLCIASRACSNGLRGVGASLPSRHMPFASRSTFRCDFTSMTRIPRPGTMATKSASPSTCRTWLAMSRECSTTQPSVLTLELRASYSARSPGGAVSGRNGGIIRAIVRSHL